VVEYPPGDPGAPPHRHPGPAFGYVLEGEMHDEELAQRKDRRARPA
jgi:quercetin dioxygenase-like cupin family protein